MPKIFCCLCSRRTDTSKQRTRVGADSFWPLLKLHSEKNDLDMASFAKDDYVCKKCHSVIAHYRMKDRGPNKIIKNLKRHVHEPFINKSVLRNAGKSLLNAPTASNADVMIEGGLIEDIKTVENACQESSSIISSDTTDSKESKNSFRLHKEKRKRK